MPGIPLARDLPRLIYHRRALSKELLLIAVTGPVFSPYGLKIKLAPRARFELATLRLTAECSTVELPGIGADNLFIVLCFQQSPQPAAVGRLFDCAQFCAHLTALWRRSQHSETDGYIADSLPAKRGPRFGKESRRRNQSLPVL